MKIINLTPHTINIYNENKEEIAVIQPSGIVAKISVNRENTNEQINGIIPTYQTTIGQSEGLPKPQKNTIYIVSGMFRANHPRFDLYQPGELLRDANGQPIGCVGLSQ
jgi:hypothetical protein